MRMTYREISLRPVLEADLLFLFRLVGEPRLPDGREPQARAKKAKPPRFRIVKLEERIARVVATVMRPRLPTAMSILATKPCVADFRKDWVVLFGAVLRQCR
jgi:hypothetical protein